MEKELGSQQTILSEQDIVRMQMVEAVPSETVNVARKMNDVPDMSVGWYTISSSLNDND